MKAFHHHLLIAVAMLLGGSLAAQHSGTSFTLDQPITGGQHSYTATEFVRLAPGFRYQPLTGTDYFMAKIGESLVVEPPAEGTTGGPEPGDFGVVGTLPGSVSVSELGSSVYTLPIQLPSGVAGMTPSLSINYNSMAGNGLLGWGWNLNGSSTISRTGKTIYHDGVQESIKFDNTDNLSYDGIRLLEIAQNSYATEVENFSKIVVKETNDYGPVWFEVLTKDGRKLHYGNTVDSRQIASGKNHVLAWHLNHVEDRMGNKIDYTYYQIEGGIRLSSIKYGGNNKTSQAHFYEVSFHYQNGRQDPIKNYVSGSEINTNAILTNIEIEHLLSGTDVQNYELEYDWFNGFYTKLSSIKAWDNENNEINSAKFVWGNESDDFNLRNTDIYISGYSTAYTLGDFNGDGKSDVACSYYNYSNGEKAFSHWAVYYGMSDGQFSAKIEMGSLAVLPNNEKFDYFISGDFNGDGMDDLLQVSYVMAGDYKISSARYRFSSGNSFTNANLELSQSMLNNDYYIQVSDLNGNGIKEVFLVKLLNSSNTWFGAWELNLQNEQLFSLFTNSPAQVGYTYTHDKTALFHVKLGDFNADGKSDILVNTNELESSIFCLHNNGYLYELTPGRFGFPNKYHRVYTGDFNGDGITDILTYAYSNSQINWELHYFNGSNAWVSGNCPPLNNLDPESIDNNHFCLVADYNGDGKDDVLDLYYKYSGIIILGSYFDIHYSRGISFLPVESQLFEQLVPFKSHIHNNFDFNGDGKVETFLFNSPGLPMQIMSYHSNEKSNLLMSFKDSFGATTSISYKRLTDPTIYTKGASLNYPLGVIQPQMNVVSSIFHQIKGGLTETNRYTYEALRIHKQGKGLLGFGKRTQKDMLSGIISIEEKDLYIGNNSLFYLPYTKKTSTYKADNNLLSEVTNTMNHKSYPDNPIRIFPFVETTFGKEFDYATHQHLKTFKSSSTYDTYGNIISNIQLMHPLSLNENATANQYDHQTTVEAQYSNPDIANWWLNKPLHTTTTTRYMTENEIMNREYFSFYSAGHPNFTMLQTKSNYPDNNFSDPLSTRTEYAYDAYGNMIFQTLSAPNAQPAIVSRTVTWAYDAVYQHRYPTYEKNDLNYESSTTYNPLYGFATKNASPNLHETLFDQHPLGIESKTIMPDGIMQVTVKRWANGHPDCPTEPLAALYYQWTKVSGQSEELVFYHQTGLELRRVSTGFNGQKVYVDKEYDNKGRLFKESLPYFAGDTPVYTTYNYDNIGRLISVVLTDGTSNTTQYIGNKVIKTNAEGQNNTQMYNAAGWLIESEDHYSNVVKYAYFSDGNLKNTAIMDNPETTVNFQYNSRRQRTMLVDPNYGQTSTIYNAFDEVLSQTNPKGQTETYIYDVLGRMTQRTDITGTTTWVYNNNGNKKGTLASVSMPGHSTTFVYDDLLRLQSETENIQGQSYTTQYTYDGFGRPFTTTYPSGYAIKQVYNSYGYTRGVADNQTSQMLYEVNLVNALGQLNKSTTGNGYITNKTNFPLTFRLKSVKTEGSDNQIIQDMEYGWTSNGNLNFRKKWISRPQNNSITESFTYDNLNRLVSIYLNGSHLGLHQYDAEGLGNLSYKKTDGQVLFQNAVYGGNNAGPHALTSATTSAGIFPPEQQSIAYNAFDKVTSITQGDKSLQITYGHHRQRIGQQYSAAGSTIYKVYAGACEYITQNGQTTIHTYLSGPEGVFALHVKNPNGTENIRYIHKDHLGSWHTITDENGNLLQELSFDAWGNLRNPATWRSFTGAPPPPLFDRGFTGHEHLYGFQLINMNGRVYDPVVSRMLSPDNFVQAPDFSQSFNRYSYCFNNPLKYTDPDGNWAGWDDLIVGGIGFTYGYVSYGLTHGDWGWKAVGSGAINAGTFLLGYYSGGATSASNIANGFAAAPGAGNGYAATVALGYSGRMAASSAISSMMPSMSIPLGGNFSVNVSSGIGFGSSGLVGGVNITGTFNDGTTVISGGYGVTGNSSSWSVGAMHNGYGGSYYRTTYGGNNSQTVGGLGLNFNKVSVRLENDFFGDRHDRWRSNALEIGIGNFVFGTTLYNNDPAGEGQDVVNLPDRRGNYNTDGYGAWRNGKVYNSPWYAGYRSGNSVTRWGYSHPSAQDLTQNNVHRLVPFGRQNYYVDYSEFTSGPFMYSGFYNPYSLW